MKRETTRELLQRLDPLLREVEQRVHTAQQGIPTFSDNHARALVEMLGALGPDDDWRESIARCGPGGTSRQLTAAVDRLDRVARCASEGRYVTWQDRQHNAMQREIEPTSFLASQGVSSCIQWRGMPLFKTAFEVALYPMLLWELRPRTILEIGSGAGASAIWLADSAQTMGLRATVFSVDLQPPSLEHPSVRFISGDARRIERLLQVEGLEEQPRPWLVIEDAHAGVLNVLRSLHTRLRPGDYLVIEDSAIKQKAIHCFMEQCGAHYRVDTYYTDFFGRNVTSALDAVLVKEPPPCAPI